ncbi:MAG: ATP-dependent Clp protease ATP-binding subunit [Candidatus Lokiarchaeota archaeon]|nr:ATP-dependent Clp protease ATP-binding subunit [Candidatus Lokiarchaeota archaeon]
MSVYNSVIFKDFNLTPRAKKAYSDAYHKSQELGHVNVNNLHVLYGCLKNSSNDIKDFLMSNGFIISQEELSDVIDKSAEENQDYFFKNKNSDPWHSEVVEAMKDANNISFSLEQHYIGIEHVILAIFNTSNYIIKQLDDYIFDCDSFKENLRSFVNGENPLMEYTTGPLDFFAEDFTQGILPSFEDGQTEENQSYLDSYQLPDFVTPLNALYFEGKLPTVYGRDQEVESLIETISKKNKCNAILTGEAGVGKSAIVEALAAKICEANVPANMFGLEILSVNLGSMVAGTQYRGQFEQKFKTLIDIAKSSPQIILFFDEIHTIFGAGGNQEGSLDAANMIKPHLARGDIKCIGATTSDEYEKIFKKDGAMKRRFFEIHVEEPSIEETKEILYNCKNSYERFHNVKFSKTVIDCIVDLSDRLISNKRFPDKAFDILDQVGARIKINNLKPCTDIVSKHKDLISCLSQGDKNIENVKSKFHKFIEELDNINNTNPDQAVKIKKQDAIEIIAEHSNVSVDQIKSGKQNFSSFNQRMESEVFGQDEALATIEDLLSCSKAGLTEKNKPLASMLFVGPTSVGKTYTAKKIAENFFGNEKAILQINMSELHDKTGINKLIGANSGYVGYEEGGILTKFVKDNPNCVVLFDEIEKADPQILNILLHLLDEGYIEDNKHQKIDFTNSIVILTSNIGHKEANKKSMGFVQDDDSSSDAYKETVKKTIKPELLARINELIVFKDLTDSHIKTIISYQLNKLRERLSENKVKITFSKPVIESIFNELKLNNIHARGIKGYIRRKIEVPVAKLIVSNSKKSKITIKDVDKTLKIY